MEILYLSRADVEELRLTMAEIIAVVEAAFRDQALGQVEMPPKPGIHTRADSFTPCRLTSNRSMRQA